MNRISSRLGFYRDLVPTALPAAGILLPRDAQTLAAAALGDVARSPDRRVGNE